MEESMPVKLRKIEYYYRTKMIPDLLYIQAFDFSYNKINCTLLLDISRMEIHALDLYFIKKGTQETLSIPMSNSFYVKARDPEKYVEIRKFF